MSFERRCRVVGRFRRAARNPDRAKAETAANDRQHEKSVHGLGALEDQQLGVVVMMMVGAASYFIGGLAMLGGLLKTRSATA